MLAVLAATVLAQAPTSVGEFFPLTPGAVWEYREDGSGGITYRDEVHPPIEVDGKPATPIVSYFNSKESSRTYYRIEGDTVYIIAYHKDKPLPVPQPIMRLSSGRARWTFEGSSVMFNEPVLLKMTGEAGLRGRRDVLGTSRDVLEVKLKGILTPSDMTQVTVDQVAIYARGIGLVEMTSDNRIGSKRSKSKLVLVKYEPAKPNP